MATTEDRATKTIKTPYGLAWEIELLPHEISYYRKLADRFPHEQPFVSRYDEVEDEDEDNDKDTDQ